MNGLELPHLEHLNLSSLRHLSDATLTVFMQAAPQLKSMDLCSAPFLFSSSYLQAEDTKRPNSAALTFNRFLYELSKLTKTFISLNLTRTSISNGAVEALANVPGLRLERLSLACCKDLSDSAIIALSLAQTNIRELDLASNTQLTAVCLKHIARNLPLLDSLNLTKVTVNCKETRFLQAITTCSKLVLSASIRQVLAVDEAEATFQLWSHKLTSLDLSYCAALSNAVLIQMCNYLVNLTELNLTSCFRLDDITLREISRCLPNLTHLSVGWCKNITDLGLLGVYHSDFTHDCVKECKCSRDKQVTYFEYNPPVKDIAPREVVPTTDHIKSAMSHNAQLPQFPISCLYKLKSLDLSVCSKISDHGVTNALSFPALSSLDLSMCPRLTDKSIIALASNNPLLESINLAQCRAISDDAIFSLLTCCRRLSHLNISGCPLITDQTINSLIKMRTKLKVLDISMCNISLEVIETLERLLPSIHTIHKRYTAVN